MAFCVLSLAGALCMGCWYPCEVDETEIVVDETMTPAVPDQKVEGCFALGVIRYYANDSELDLILRAERVASTVGPEWFSATTMPEVHGYRSFPLFLIPDAVNEEALVYYAKRIRSAQAGELPELAWAASTYSARILSPDEVTGPQLPNTTVVHLQIGYNEGWGLGSYSGFAVQREIAFDQSGEVVSVSYDGEVAFTVVN